MTCTYDIPAQSTQLQAPIAGGSWDVLLGPWLAKALQRSPGQHNAKWQMVSSQVPKPMDGRGYYEQGTDGEEGCLDSQEMRCILQCSLGQNY